GGLLAVALGVERGLVEYLCAEGAGIFGWAAGTQSGDQEESQGLHRDSSRSRIDAEGRSAPCVVRPRDPRPGQAPRPPPPPPPRRGEGRVDMNTPPCALPLAPPLPPGEVPTGCGGEGKRERSGVTGKPPPQAQRLSAAGAGSLDCGRSPPDLTVFSSASRR